MTETNEMLVKGTRTHPYVAAVAIDPVMWAQFESTFEGRPEVKIRELQLLSARSMDRICGLRQQSGQRLA